eukprot:TRINITY_DN3918_c0_g1_i2.p1 TRINITY_DN3918_c0_g1~~TRINITY_DN3918_c0_g1_i2.p1  ORF type:complete len:2133 (-),score=248.58 TRINITY_DN3918_c0_g1_i2:344-6742(-)
MKPMECSNCYVYGLILRRLNTILLLVFSTLRVAWSGQDLFRGVLEGGSSDGTSDGNVLFGQNANLNFHDLRRIGGSSRSDQKSRLGELVSETRARRIHGIGSRTFPTLPRNDIVSTRAPELATATTSSSHQGSREILRFAGSPVAIRDFVVKSGNDSSFPSLEVPHAFILGLLAHGVGLPPVHNASGAREFSFETDATEVALFGKAPHDSVLAVNVWQEHNVSHVSIIYHEQIRVVLSGRWLTHVVALSVGDYIVDLDGTEFSLRILQKQDNAMLGEPRLLRIYSSLDDSPGEAVWGRTQDETNDDIDGGSHGDSNQADFVVGIAGVFVALVFEGSAAPGSWTRLTLSDANVAVMFVLSVQANMSGSFRAALATKEAFPEGNFTLTLLSTDGGRMSSVLRLAISFVSPAAAVSTSLGPTARKDLMTSNRGNEPLLSSPFAAKAASFGASGSISSSGRIDLSSSLDLSYMPPLGLLANGFPIPPTRYITKQPMYGFETDARKVAFSGTAVGIGRIAVSVRNRNDSIDDPVVWHQERDVNHSGRWQTTEVELKPGNYIIIYGSKKMSLRIMKKPKAPSLQQPRLLGIFAMGGARIGKPLDKQGMKDSGRNSYDERRLAHLAPQMDFLLAIGGVAVKPVFTGTAVPGSSTRLTLLNGNTSIMIALSAQANASGRWLASVAKTMRLSGDNFTLTLVSEYGRRQQSASVSVTLVVVAPDFQGEDRIDERKSEKFRGPARPVLHPPSNMPQLDDSSDSLGGEAPWLLSVWQKVWFQVGWLVYFTSFVVFGLVLLNVYSPSRQPSWMAQSDGDGASSRGDGNAGSLIWDPESSISTFLDVLTITFAVGNFVLFAIYTEFLNSISHNVSSRTVWPDNLGLLVHIGHNMFEELSLAFFAFAFVLRAVVADSHPYWKRYGAQGSHWMYLTRDIFAIIDLLAIILTAIDVYRLIVRPEGMHLRLNCLGLCVARMIEIVSRRGWGVSAGLADMHSMVMLHRRLLCSVFALGGVMWVVVSGLYFCVNQSNAMSEWHHALVRDFETGELHAWQRFESIPSSMFYVLLNLIKEQPIPFAHVEPLQRVIVALTNFFITPVFSLPTSIFGTLLLQHAILSQRGNGGGDVECEEEEEEEEDAQVVESEAGCPEQDNDDTPSGVGDVACRLVHVAEQEDREEQRVSPTTRPWTGLAIDASPILTHPFSVTCFLSFGSIHAYFFYTATLVSADHGVPYLFGIAVPVGPWMLAILDGAVGLLFGWEWFLRLQSAIADDTAYLFSAYGIVDFASSIFGIVHLITFFLAHMCKLAYFVQFDSVYGPYLCAACVVRVFKLERYVLSFEDMRQVVNIYRSVLMASLSISCLLLAVFSTLMYASDRLNPDPEIRSNYGSLPRALWAEVLNLTGEFILCDFTPEGKGLAAVVAVFVVSIYVMPLACFSAGFVGKILFEHNADGVEHSDDASVHDSTRPWQADCRREGDGFSQDAYDMLFAHHHDESPGARCNYRWIAVASTVLTACSLFVTVISTVGYFHPSLCRKRSTCLSFAETFFTVDCVCVVFFAFEITLRIVALRGNYFVSFAGICDILSFSTICLSMGPMRDSFFHPVFSSNGSWVESFDNIAVPLRLLRIHSLQFYFKQQHIFMNAIWLNRWKLFMSIYALVSVWYAHATLLYLIENDNNTPSWQAERYDLTRLTMADRYRDVLTALQYSLIHLTGDFPIYEYRFASRVVLLCGILFGMCSIASFVAIFSTSFITHVASERFQEIEDIRAKRMMAARNIAIKIQRQFRQRKERQQALANHGELNLSETRQHFSGSQTRAEQADSATSKKTAVRVRILRLVERQTTIGRYLMLFFNVVLVSDVTCTILRTIPMLVETYSQYTLVEILFGFIFVVEYVLRIMARGPAYMRNPWRLFDFFCLLPLCRHMNFGVLVKYWSVKILPNALKSWNFELLHQCLLTLRAVRILDFPYFRRGIVLVSRVLFDTCGYLGVPAFFATAAWLELSAFFFWAENVYQGPARHSMTSIPSAMYWTSMFFVGEWPMADFSPGVGSRACIVTVLFGVVVFALPFGVITEAVQSSLQRAAEEDKEIQELHEEEEKRTLNKDKEKIVEHAKRRNSHGMVIEAASRGILSSSEKRRSIEMSNLSSRFSTRH